MTNTIFTFDKTVEQKTGVFTLPIFSIALFLFPFFIVIFDMICVDLATKFLATRIPLYRGLNSEAFSLMMSLVYALLAFSIPVTICVSVNALHQLMICYVELKDGRLVKLKWQPRPRGHVQASILLNTLSQEVPNLGNMHTYRTLTKAVGLFEAITHIQNPQLVENYLNGSFICYNIEDYPLTNIQLIKQHKRKLVITADTIIKGKQKRKKMNIYCIYRDMERLSSLCTGGLTS